MKKENVIKNIELTVTSTNFEKIIKEEGEKDLVFKRVPIYLGGTIIAQIKNKIYNIIKSNTLADNRIYTLALEYECRKPYRDVRWMDYEHDKY